MLKEGLFVWQDAQIVSCLLICFAPLEGREKHLGEEPSIYGQLGCFWVACSEREQRAQLYSLFIRERLEETSQLWSLVN